MSPTWLTVARKDVEDAIRSRTLLVMTVVLALLIVLLVALPGLFADGFPVELAVYLITYPAAIVVPLVALVASYLAVAGERESGSLKLLLGLPPTRRDVVLGKFLGRLVVVQLSVLIAFAVGLVVAFLAFGEAPLGPFLVTTVLTAVLATSFVGLAVGFSAGAPTGSRAIAPAIGVYVVVIALWDLFVQVLPFAADYLFSVSLDPTTVDVINVLSPRSAYGRLINAIVVPWLRETLPSGLAGGLPQFTPSGDSVFLESWFLVVLLLAWAAVPVVVGYWRFERADLA